MGLLVAMSQKDHELGEPQKANNLLASVMLRALFLSALPECALLETAVEEASYPHVLPLEMRTHSEVPAEQTGWERK